MVAEMACCTVATAANRAARRSSSATSSVVNELHRHRPRDHTRADALVEEEPYRGASALAVIECPVVHVHSDERVGFAAIEPTCVSHRVIEGALPVIEPVCNALAQVARDLLLDLARHVLANDVATKRKRKTGFLEPPRTHVGDEVQPFILVSELAFVDQQPRVHITAMNGVLDLIEGNHDGDEIGLE